MAERKGLDGKDIGVNSPQPKYNPTVIRGDGTRTVLDALKHHFDLYYLTHTPLEEMQPPTEEELKKLTEIEKLTLAPPIPSKVNPVLPHFPGLTIGQVSRHKKTPEEIQARRRALFYASSLFGTGTGLDHLEDVVKIGIDFEKRLEEIGKEYV